MSGKSTLQTCHVKTPSIEICAIRPTYQGPDTVEPSMIATPANPFRGPTMILTTTATIEGKRIVGYLGIVSGESIMGTNIFKDLFAGVRDIVGGRSVAYEEEIAKARDSALMEMRARAQAVGADAVVGVNLDTEAIGGDSRTLLMVSVSGTAVKLG
jgi:uncharacterized protein YbjQ (UPF0145 family)